MNKAILVGIDDDSIKDFDKALVECERLLEADNLELKAVITQKSRKMDPNTALRSGKLSELKEMAKDDVDVIVFLNNLNEGILNKLGAQIDCPIIDRTALILDIFSSRARSREAMIQIEMARLKYNMSNKIIDGNNIGHSRGGSFMNRGAGETKSDIIIRNTQKRISELARELKKIEKAKHEKDNHRNKSMLKKVALVGYTNAGKSSFMNALLKLNSKPKEVLSKDMLFATLDASIRNISYKNYEFLLFDTVGFVSDLPHELVEAFKSTLSYAKEADLLLNILDVSSDYEHEAEVTRRTLAKIGASDIPVIDIYNKIDLICTRDENRLEVSTYTNEGLEKVLDTVIETIYKKEDTKECLIPYSDIALISEYKNKTDIRIIEHLEDGVMIRISGLNEYLDAFRAFEVH